MMTRRNHGIIKSFQVYIKTTSHKYKSLHYLILYAYTKLHTYILHMYMMETKIRNITEKFIRFKYQQNLFGDHNYLSIESAITIIYPWCLSVLRHVALLYLWQILHYHRC